MNWKKLAGHETTHEISDLGIIRKLNGEVVKQFYASNGRSNYYFKTNIFGKSYLVHRLILRTFVGEPPEGTEAAHDDGDTFNNVLNNLKWKTSKENSLDRTRHGTQTRKGNWTKLTPAQARRLIGAVNKGASQKSQCDKYNLSCGYVSQLVNGFKGKSL